MWIGPSTVQLYSLLPYKVNTIQLSLANNPFRLGQDVPYTIAINTDRIPSTHTMRMDVIDPSGNIVKHYSRNITVTAGNAQGTIPLALNDQPGRWTIKLKD